MFSKLHIQTKLLLTILPLLFIAILASAYLNNRYEEQEMQKQAQASAQTYGDLIRESLVEMMTTHERVEDDYLFRINALRDIQNLRVHFSFDNLHLKDIFQDDARIERLRKREQSIPALSPEEQIVFQTGNPIWEKRGQLFNAIIPFTATAKCQRCHEVPAGHVLGAAEMTIPLDRIAMLIQNNWIRSIWVLIIFTTIAFIFSIFLYHYLVTKRLQSLVEATKIIGSGNLGHPVAKDSSRDELGELASAFDTMRVQLKAAQEKLIHTERLSTIGQMASSIIHDFRSPMSTINLVVDSLQRGNNMTPEKTEEWYRLIRSAIQRMVAMAQELLDFSRGEIHLEKTEFSVDEFMLLLVESVKMNLEQTKIQLNVDKQYKGNGVFDAERLHRAMINIINNAQDAMPQGGTVQLGCSRANGSIIFVIADNGPGIPLEIKDRIFEAFVTAGKKKGTGLGLAITKRIIEQHGGTIQVESEKGKGTIFVIRIPAS